MAVYVEEKKGMFLQQYSDSTSNTYSLAITEQQKLYNFISDLQKKKMKGTRLIAMDLEQLADQDLQPGFNRFPLLPPETREMIWKAALPGPRTITVSTTALHTNTDPPETQYRPHTDTKKDPSALRQVCSESRRVFLANYETSFLGHFCSSNLRPPIYFNWKRDSLYFPDRVAMACFGGHKAGLRGMPKRNGKDKAWQGELRHLAVGSFFYEYDSGLDVFEFLTTLETLVLEKPCNFNYVFQEPFEGSHYQKKKEILLWLNEIWDEQIALGFRSERPAVRWITSRNLQKKAIAEKVS